MFRFHAPLSLAGLEADRRGAMWRSWLLIAALLAMLLGCGWMIGGENTFLVALGGGGAALVVAPNIPAKRIFRFHRARKIERLAARELHVILDALAGRAGLRASPDLYWLPSSQINAMTVASGKQSGIGLSDGALRGLTTREIEGVMAHEIAHIRNGDTRLMLIADSLARMTVVAAFLGLGAGLLLSLTGHPPALWIVLLFGIAPTTATLFQTALSRAREFAADLTAAELVGDPTGLISALNKAEHLRHGLLRELSGAARVLPQPSAFQSHPPTRQRIERLLSHMRLDPVAS